MFVVKKINPRTWFEKERAGYEHYETTNVYLQQHWFYAIYHLVIEMKTNIWTLYIVMHVNKKKTYSKGKVYDENFNKVNKDDFY